MSGGGKSDGGVRRWVWVGVLGFCTLAYGQDSLLRYAACKLPGGPEVVETAPLGAGVTTRMVKTLQGSRQIAMEAAERVMFAYLGQESYANVKAERLPAKTYAEEKQLLIGEFEYILSSPGTKSRNYGLKPKLNGFEIYGLDGVKLEGGVQGIYLFFDEARHEVVTIYFLNQNPGKGPFKTIEEYERLRDGFLASYTACLAVK